MANSVNLIFSAISRERNHYKPAGLYADGSLLANSQPATKRGKIQQFAPNLANEGSWMRSVAFIPARNRIFEPAFWRGYLVIVFASSMLRKITFESPKQQQWQKDRCHCAYFRIGQWK